MLPAQQAPVKYRGHDEGPPKTVITEIPSYYPDRCPSFPRFGELAPIFPSVPVSFLTGKPAGELGSQ